MRQAFCSAEAQDELLSFTHLAPPTGYSQKCPVCTCDTSEGSTSTGSSHVCFGKSPEKKRRAPPGCRRRCRQSAVLAPPTCCGEAAITTRGGFTPPSSSLQDTEKTLSIGSQPITSGDSDWRRSHT